jgi:hypothetical protein
MVKLLDTYDLPKLNQQDINHLNTSIISYEIEAAIVSQNNRRSESDRSLAEFYQTFKEEVMPAYLKFFHVIEREGTLPKSFYESSIILIPKLEKYTTKQQKQNEQIIVGFL